MDNFAYRAEIFYSFSERTVSKGTACHPIKSSAAGRRPAKLVVYYIVFVQCTYYCYNYSIIPFICWGTVRLTSKGMMYINTKTHICEIKTVNLLRSKFRTSTHNTTTHVNVHYKQKHVEYNKVLPVTVRVRGCCT